MSDKQKGFVIAYLEAKLYVRLTDIKIKSKEKEQRTEEFNTKATQLINETYPDKKISPKEMREYVSHLRDFYTITLRNKI